MTSSASGRRTLTDISAISRLCLSKFLRKRPLGLKTPRTWMVSRTPNSLAYLCPGSGEPDESDQCVALGTSWKWSSIRDWIVQLRSTGLDEHFPSGVRPVPWNPARTFELCGVRDLLSRPGMPVDRPTRSGTSAGSGRILLREVQTTQRRAPQARRCSGYRLSCQVISTSLSTWATEWRTRDWL